MNKVKEVLMAIVTDVQRSVWRHLTVYLALVFLFMQDYLWFALSMSLAFYFKLDGIHLVLEKEAKMMGVDDSDEFDLLNDKAEEPTI